MGLAGQIGTDSSVGSIGSSASLCGSVDLHVIDGQVLEVLGVCVGLEVVDESEHHSDGLLGPSSQSLAELSSLSSPTDSSVVGSVGHTSPVSEDVLEILSGFCNGESLHCLGSLVGVFIMDAEVPG